MAENRLFVGLGNPWRGDDGVGPWLVDALAGAGRDALDLGGDGAALIGVLANRADVVLFDASRSGAPAGTVTCFDARARPLPTGYFHYSTHAFGLAEAVETARNLDRLPARLEVYAIEGAAFGAGQGLSAPVLAAARRLLASWLAV
ncbi:MAG: hydrogenase maturation protease [Burkholderiaceae bacterium]